MSAQVARTAQRIATPVARTVRTSRRASKKIIPYQKDENGLPIPHVPIIVRDTHRCRLQDHYHNTLRDDLMYMTYTHDAVPRKPFRKPPPTYDPADPYSKHRYNPPLGGTQQGLRRPMEPTTPENIIFLERIQLHTMIKEAVASRSELLGAIMAFRAISGESEGAGGRRTVEGVQILRGRKSVSGWVRLGIPLGVKVDLKGPKMYDFLGMLVEFILPRLREYPGFLMPRPSANNFTPGAASGVISFGLPPEAMGLFPQIEVNLDSYPKSYGMHIHLITSARGLAATNRARALLSGFQVPFTRR